MRFSAAIGGVALFISASRAVFGSSAATSASSVLKAAAVSCGETRLRDFAGITMTARAKRFGLNGSYDGIAYLRTGWFVWQADYGASFAAEGLDEQRRWRMDASRRVHPLDSREAKTIAVTEAYLARRGYLSLSDPAHLAFLGAKLDGRRTLCDVIAATPSDGRTAVIWVEQASRLVRRIDIQRSERVETIRYEDYRRVDGVELPFSITIDDGDEPETAAIAVASYTLVRKLDTGALAPPAQSLGDALIRTGSTAQVPLTLDAATGFPIVFAEINGHKAAPFIVDTGGHDIVTPDAARQFRLKSAGSGVSFGAGAGTTSTAFARTSTVTLGGAEMVNQPFVVLDLDLGRVANAQGRSVPIAGILGLELFERFIVTLNFPAHRLTLKLAPNAANTRGTTLPISFTSDEPLVDAEIDGRAGSFAVDTGNNEGLILSQHWLADLGLSHPPADTDPRVGESVGGQVMFQEARAASVRLGRAEIENVPVLVSDMRSGSLSSRSQAGSLGTAILARFRVTFDYADEKMVLSR